MNEQMRPSDTWTMEDEVAALERASKKALAMRRASGEILTYHLDGWVVQEYPGGRVERLAPVGQFRAEDFPYPGFVPPPKR